MEVFKPKELIYFVCDHNTNGIYLITKNLLLANFISKGILDSSVHTIYAKVLDSQMLFFADKLNKHYYLEKSSKILELGVSRLTDFFINNKTVIHKRKVFIERWMEFCNLQLDSKNSFLSSEAFVLLSEEISKCTNGVPTQLIVELANIKAIDNPSIYLNELVMLIDGEKIRKLRIHTIFEKYLDLLNSTNESADLEICYTNAVEELLRNAHI